MVLLMKLVFQALFIAVGKPIHISWPATFKIYLIVCNNSWYLKICCKRVCYVEARLYDNTLLWGSKHGGIWVTGKNVYAHVKALFNAHNMCRWEAESKWAAPAKCRMTWKHLDITEVRDVWFVAKKITTKWSSLLAYEIDAGPRSTPWPRKM